MLSIYTSQGEEVFCLPDEAACKEEKRLLEDVACCPCKMFDPQGSICIPERCVYYTEDPEDLEDFPAFGFPEALILPEG